MRWKNPELDTIIESIQKLDFDDPKGLELGQQFVKLAAQEMPIIPIMSYNVFSVCDETYWTGFPDCGESVHRPGCRTGPTPSTCSSRSSRRRHNPAAA